MNTRLLDWIEASFSGCTVDYDKQVQGGLLTIVWSGWASADPSQRTAEVWAGLKSAIRAGSRPPKLVLLTPGELAAINGETST